LPPISRRRFFLRIPLVYFEMTGDERAAAAVEMWSETMVQMGKDPDRLISERATALDENPESHGS
jgi:hypothetical protein